MSVQLPNLLATIFGEYFNNENRKMVGYGRKISKVSYAAPVFYRDTWGEYRHMRSWEKVNGMRSTERLEEVAPRQAG
jgi:hypothetical protein